MRRAALSKATFIKANLIPQKDQTAKTRATQNDKVTPPSKNALGRLSEKTILNAARLQTFHFRKIIFYSESQNLALAHQDGKTYLEKVA